MMFLRLRHVKISWASYTFGLISQMYKMPDWSAVRRSGNGLRNLTMPTSVLCAMIVC